MSHQHRHSSKSHPHAHRRHHAAKVTGATVAGVGVGAGLGVGCISPEMRQAGVTFAHDVLRGTPQPLIVGLGVGGALGLGVGYLLGEHGSKAAGFVDQVTASRETPAGLRR